MAVVEIRDLSYHYPDQTLALDGVSILIEKQSRVAILGANGSGKSTLLQHLNGLLLPQRGKVSIMGLEVCKGHLTQIRKKVGIVFDNPDEQLFSASVYEDIAFGPRNLGLDEGQVKDRVEQVMKLIDIEDLGHRPPYNLSLGQKKKVAMAGVLAMEPVIMVFDEPFSGLDPYSLQQLTALLDKLYTLGHTLVITTHDVDFAYGWADECIVLNQGHVLAQGPRELLEDEVLMKKARLKLPSLYDIFSGTDFNPKSPQEAKDALSKLFKRK